MGPVAQSRTLSKSFSRSNRSDSQPAHAARLDSQLIPPKNRSPTSPCPSPLSPSPLSLPLIQPRRHPPLVQGRLTIHLHNNWPQALSLVRTGSCFRGRSNILKRSLAQLWTERGYLRRSRFAGTVLRYQLPMGSQKTGKLRPCVVHIYLTIFTKIQMSFSATPNTFSPVIVNFS